MQAQDIQRGIKETAMERVSLSRQSLYALISCALRSQGLSANRFLVAQFFERGNLKGLAQALAATREQCEMSRLQRMPFNTTIIK